jgi:hypothetical protein
MGAKPESQTIMLEAGIVSLMKSAGKVDFFEYGRPSRRLPSAQAAQQRPPGPASVPC